MDITETEAKGLESAVKQPAGIAATITEAKTQSFTQEDLEKSLVSDEHYKLEKGRYVRSAGSGYRLEVELEQNPANGDPLWYIALFKVSNGIDVQLYSASGHSYDIAELQKLQADALKYCEKKKIKIAD